MALIGKVWLSEAMLPALAELTGTHRTTVARWYAKRQLPPAVYLLLDLLHNGRLSRIHADWEGWRLHSKSGDLVTPAGQLVSAGQIMAIPYRLHELSTLRHAAVNDASNVANLPVQSREFLLNPADFNAHRAPRATVSRAGRRHRSDERDQDHPPVHDVSVSGEP